jgi:molybdate transport system substrate-binding protein
MLARQLEHGAEYDLYLSAHRRYVDQLVRSGVADAATAVNYAHGRLGQWPGDAIIESARHVAIANPAHAPYGAATKQALDRQGLWPKIEKRIVYGENVRQALQYATTRNADVAITAWSLVHNRGGKLIDERWHDPILQAGVVPKRSRNPEAARRMLQFLLSPAGQKLLADNGFSPVR